MDYIEMFYAPVVTAIVDDPRSETGKRDAQYIPATSIPESILAAIGYNIESARHPHRVPGMAWDLAVGGWRNMKNAKNLDTGIEAEVVCDTIEKTFTLI